MSKSIYLFLICIFLISCNQEEPKEHEVQHVKILNEKLFSNSDSLIYYLEARKNWYPKLSDSLKTETDFIIANYYNQIHKTDSAYHYLNKSLRFSKNKLTNTREKLYYITLAYTYKKNGDYLNSLNILERLEQHIKTSKDYSTLAEINKQKQSIYKLLKNYKKAIVFNKKSVKYFALAKDTSKLVNSLILQSSLNYYNFKNKKEAYRLLDSVLTINLSNNKFKNILKNQVYQSYGIFNYYDKNFQASYKNYYKALSYLQEPKTKSDSVGLANSYANIAEVCLELKKYNLSSKYNDSVEIYTKILNAGLRNFHLQNKLRLSYESKDDFSKISQNLSALNRTMSTNYQKRITNELTALKEANKKEKELLITNQKVSLHNAALKQKQIMLFSIVGFLGLSALIGILYYRQRKLKFQKEEIFMQQRLFRAQMNPHFTSNILFTIQDLILENKEKANKYLIKFSRLLRLNLENSMQNYTLIEKEMEVLSKYLDLQQLRFPDTFRYKINTDDLDVDLLSIPPMLIQPFVENAIEHGFKNIDYLGKITIDLSEKDQFISCKITDNGVGLQTNNSKENHTSASTLLIKKLLKNMSNQDVVIQNNPSGKGTNVTFNMPFIEV